MTTRIDIKLTQNQLKQWEIAFNDDGDFETVQGFDTALQMSILSEKRASPEEVPSPQLRRGWVGNEDQEFPIGSKVWLVDQSRRNSDTLNDLKTHAEGGFQWFIDEDLLDEIEVNTLFTLNGAALDVTLTVDNVPTRVLFDLWAMTGGN